MQFPIHFGTGSVSITGYFAFTQTTFDSTTYSYRSGEKVRLSINNNSISKHNILADQGRRLYVFKVFIEYPLNLGSHCIFMFSVNLTFGETLNHAILLFFSPKIATLGAINV